MNTHRPTPQATVNHSTTGLRRFRSVALAFSALFTVFIGQRPMAAGATVPGSVDLTFDPTANGSLLGLTGRSPLVNTVLEQPDGKLIIAGEFTGVNGTLRNNIARLNADGTVDESFQPGYGPDGSVDGMALQSDGKVVIIGSFQRVNVRSFPLIARLNPNGSLDDTFSCPMEGDLNLRLTGVAIQTTGKIWIGGIFTHVNGVSRRNLARLNSDGSLDTSVDPQVQVPGNSVWVNQLALQVDDKLLVAGAWSDPVRSLIRLNADGSADPGFATLVVEYPIVGPDIRDVSCNAQGSIAIVGNFTSVNGIPRLHVARLNPNGSVDTRFSNGEGPNYNFLGHVWMLPDDKLILSGNFDYFNGIPRQGIARLNSDGTVDPTFDSGDAGGVPPGHSPQTVEVLPLSNGDVLVATHPYWENETTNGVFRLDATGRRVPGFSPLLHAAVESVGRMVLQPDGKVIFGTFGSYTRSSLVRVNTNGVRDESFAPDFDFAYIHAVTLQPDNKILVATTPPMDPQTGIIVRLNPDGTVDDEFQAPSIAGGEAPVETLALQPDGKILVAGLVWSVEGHPHQGIVRLHPDGSFDDSFQPVPVYVSDDPGYGIEHVIVLPDGKIFIAGGFRWATDGPGGIGLLESDGTVDQNFVSNVSPIFYAATALRQPDGKFLLSVYPGNAPSGLIRINPDGTEDPSFQPAVGGESYGLALQADGRILVTGGGWPQTGHITRLNSDGSLESIFPVEFYPWGASGLLVQPDGQILVSGGFQSVSGIPMHGIARLNNDVRWKVELIAAGNPVRIAVSGQAGIPLIIEASTDLATWTTLTEITSGSAPVICTDSEAPKFTQRFYRARQTP